VEFNPFFGIIFVFSREESVKEGNTVKDCSILDFNLLPFNQKPCLDDEWEYGE